FFFSSRRRHTRSRRDWSSDVCSSDLPFALSNEAAEEPSVFVVDLMLSGVRHTYGFAVDDDRVVEEWLYSYPRRRKRVVFERDERSEERRVGKESRDRKTRHDDKKHRD